MRYIAPTGLSKSWDTFEECAQGRLVPRMFERHYALSIPRDGLGIFSAREHVLT